MALHRLVHDAPEGEEAGRTALRSRDPLSTEFRALFEASPTPFLVLSPPDGVADYTILAANEAFLRATMTQHAGIIGCPMFEVFRDNPEDPDASGARNLRASLDRVLLTRLPDVMAIQRYDIRRPLAEGGGFEERYWSPINTPVLDQDGALTSILHRSEDVTEVVRLRGDRALRDQSARDQQGVLRRLRESNAALAREVAERRRAEARSVESDERLRLALDVGAMGTITCVLASGRAHLDRRAREMFGWSEAETAWDVLVERVHPEDREACLQSVHECVDAADGASECDYRILRPDGAVAWIHSRLAVAFEGHGAARRPARVLLTLQDVTERKRFAEAQQEFLAMASHELRNPLAALRGNAQLMQRRGRFDQEVAQALVEQCTHLERLVRDLLDVTMANAGHFTLRRSPFDLVELVRAVLADEQASSAHHLLILRRAPAALVGWWDRDRLRQVLSHLLSNAVKYSPDGRDVFVDMDVHDGEVTVSIADQGIGIAAEEQDRIFHRFYRLEARTGRVDGLGLGLDVTRALVEAHGGRIEVESEEGRGSTFRFTIPVTAQGDLAGSQASAAPLPAAPARPEPPRILVVDDDPTIRLLLQNVLEDEGYEVDVAGDGWQALTAIERESYQLVVLDLMMPNLDGPGLLRELDQRDLRDGVRVLVVSASHETRRYAEELGADGMVEKPFDLDRLIVVVSDLAARSPRGDVR